MQNYDAGNIPAVFTFTRHVFALGLLSFWKLRNTGIIYFNDKKKMKKSTIIVIFLRLNLLLSQNLPFIDSMLNIILKFS